MRSVDRTIAEATYRYTLGDKTGGTALLRMAPKLVCRFSERAAVSAQVTRVDVETASLYFSSQSLEKRENWSELEFCCWKILEIYPFNIDVTIRYGDALLMQRKYPDAESVYRSAFAMGGARNSLMPKLQFAAKMQGYDGWLLPDDNLTPKNNRLRYPDRIALTQLGQLFWGESLPLKSVLAIQRAARTYDDAIALFIRDDRFRYRNVELFQAYALARARSATQN